MVGDKTRDVAEQVSGGQGTDGLVCHVGELGLCMKSLGQISVLVTGRQGGTGGVQETVRWGLQQREGCAKGVGQEKWGQI